MAKKTIAEYESLKTFAGFNVGLNLPDPPNNPYTFTITTNCRSPVINTVTLTPTTGAPIPSSPLPSPLPPPPIPVSFPPEPAGDYVLTVTITCGTDKITITQDVTLPAPPASSSTGYSS